MKILAVIIARANSTRLKNKNLRKIKKKTLVEITINFVKKIKMIDDVILSSDSKKINLIAKKKKIKVVKKRPHYLSKKNTPSAHTVIHALKFYEKKYQLIDAIALFQPTSPFREIKFINKCLKKFLKLKKNVVSSSKIEKNNFKGKPNGSIYLIFKKDLLRFKSFNNKNTLKVYSNDLPQSIDIDNYSDLIKARKLAKTLSNGQFIK